MGSMRLEQYESIRRVLKIINKVIIFKKQLILKYL